MENIYHFNGEDSILSPSLIYYRDMIIDNTKKAIRIAGSADHLWPHIKTHKSKDVLDIQIKMGIHRFKCATLSELEMTAGTEATDILFAYPLVGPNIERFLDISERHPDKNIYALCDDPDQLEDISRISMKRGRTIGVFVDVNTGMNRTGITYDGAIGLAEKIAGLHGGRFIGFHCYDGDRHEKEYSRREEKVIETIDDINRLKEKVSVFCDRPVIIAGGSPSFPCYANNMPGGYYSPGTVFIYDAGYLEQFPDLPFTPAAAVLSRVVSHPGKGIFTLDTGYKAISAEQSRPGILLDVPGSEPMFQSEEHWTYRMTEGHEGECPEIGKLVYIIPWHVCPTTALYSKVHVVEKGKVVGTWNITARDRMI